MSRKILVTPGRIARKLGLWIGSFFVIAAICLLGWAYANQRHQSLAELHRLAETNTKFLGDLRLPYSPRLASQLSEILHLEVGFYFEGTPDRQQSANRIQAIRDLVEKAPNGTAQRLGDREIALAPLLDQRGYFFLIRDLEAKGSTTEAWWRGAALPIGILACGCAALAFGLGRSIVSPLTRLTDWLPNLRDEVGDSEKVPSSILSRNDEVGRLACALAALQTELAEEKEKRAQSEKLAALGRIATSLAHEVKNPAAAIRLHADLLLDHSPSSLGSHESLEMIREEIDQINDLVNQWLFVSKASPSRKRPHDLKDLLFKVQARMTRLLEDRRIDFRILPEEDAPYTVFVDAPRIEQVFRNLIQNAIDAIPENGRIVVQLASTETEILAIFRDSGPGFSREALRHFREPFFSEREGGMGIGLTLACEVIESHGGRIQVNNRDEDKESSGATVTVCLTKPDPDP